MTRKDYMARGVAGWPLRPSVRFPGELTLACPRCESIDISIQGSCWASWGTAREIDSRINCNACEYSEDYQAKPLKW